MTTVAQGRTRAESFLDRHAALREARTRSRVWPGVKTSAELVVDGQRLYVVGGDTLGGEDELYLDRLARGANVDSSDDLSRQLFLELPPPLRDVVARELLRPEEGHTK